MTMSIARASYRGASERRQPAGRSAGCQPAISGVPVSARSISLAQRGRHGRHSRKKSSTQRPSTPVRMSDKIKLLFLSAQPCGSTPLRTDWELRDVDARIQAGLKPNRFEVAFAPALKRTDLQDALMRHRPQVVHFSGHSDATKGILLENDRGREAYVSGSELAELFAILRGTIRIVVLNSCDSSAIARQFQHFIDY